MNGYKEYISKYGNFNYILNVIIYDDVCETEKNTILSLIFDTINNKVVTYDIFDYTIRAKWRTSNDKDLFHYYTDYEGDKAMFYHTVKTMEDIQKTIGKDKFELLVTKPLTICVFYI